MHFILITKNQESIETLRKILFAHKIIVLSSLRAINTFHFNENDLIISDIEDEEDRWKLEEILNNAYRLICIYHKSNHYPFEQYSKTIFIPSQNLEETILEAIARLGSVKEGNDILMELVGSSIIMEKVRERIARYAKSKYAIHLSGSTGTGKNVAAKIIHRLSGLKSKMVYVNCGSCYNAGLIESNFFGYAKGSFTGSSGSRNGYLKNADKSTLFLDEIENMSLLLQEILLDTIDSGTFRCVGSDAETTSDFRIITASNIDLEELLKSGKLRKDFYYRIAHREIHLPDLKDHKEDIPELVQYYEKTHSIIRNRITDYTPLYNNEWEGNIRQLFNAIGLIHEKIEEDRLCSFYSSKIL